MDVRYASLRDGNMRLLPLAWRNRANTLGTATDKYDLSLKQFIIMDKSQIKVLKSDAHYSAIALQDLST